MNEVFKKYFLHITRREDVKLTTYQKQLISTFLTTNNISILKTRDIGFTTSIISYVLFLIESNSNKKNVTIFVHNNATANYIMNIMCSYLLNNFPDNVSDKFKFYFSKGIIKLFEYDISIINPSNDLKKSYALTGFTPDLLIIDEAECIGEENFKSLERFFKVMPSRLGQIICGSSIHKFDGNKSFQKRHFKSLKLSNVYTRNIILEKKIKIIDYKFRNTPSMDLREVF
jgi:hypothetical protein